jgi:2'-5' RNA ligase
MDRTRTTKSFSLWLVPTGKAYERLAAQILTLSRKYSTPKFPPHFTLLGGISGTTGAVKAESARLARRLRAFKVRLTTVSSCDEYFRCLFIRASRTHPLVEARDLASRIVAHSERRAFLPHLSLMYGEISGHTKKRIIRSLGWRFDLEFEVEQLHLFRTTGHPRDWRRVKTFRLKPRP